MSALRDNSDTVILQSATLAVRLNDRLRISGIVEQSVVDGTGLRMTVFTQGCPHRCPGCHNPETHSSRGGFDMSAGDVLARFDANPLLSGMTLSGGEPLEQAAALVPLANAVKARGKDLWCYTGYTFETLALKLRGDEKLAALLGAVDVLVDGRYEEAKRNLALPYRGSANQRVLHLPASLASGRAVPWTGNSRFASTRLFPM